MLRAGPLTGQGDALELFGPGELPHLRRRRLTRNIVTGGALANNTCSAANFAW